VIADPLLVDHIFDKKDGGEKAISLSTMPPFTKVHVLRMQHFLRQFHPWIGNTFNTQGEKSVGS